LYAFAVTPPISACLPCAARHGSSLGPYPKCEVVTMLKTWLGVVAMGTLLCLILAARGCHSSPRDKDMDAALLRAASLVLDMCQQVGVDAHR
jgi:hypothetical protein